jgi:hypothetical protein
LRGKGKGRARETTLATCKADQRFHTRVGRGAIPSTGALSSLDAKTKALKEEAEGGNRQEEQMHKEPGE